MNNEFPTYDDFKEIKDKYDALKQENYELKRKLHYILGGGIVSETLDPVLSETPSVVINTKAINITFDNHTNDFKADKEE